MRKIPVFSVAYAKVFAWGLFSATLGLCISALFFRDSLLMATSGLSSFMLIYPMNELLDENRDAIWVHRRSAWEANLVLVFKVIAIFLAVFTVALLCQLLAPHHFLDPLRPNGELFSNAPWPVFMHNLRVLLACLLLAFIYRAGGLLLVISWNALNWSVSLFAFFNNAHAAGATHAWFYSLATLPHLILETAAYVTSGMAGVFLSKAVFKYRLSSAKFFRVSRACVVILLGSVVSLWLAMRFEVSLAQSVLRDLHR